MRYEKSYKVKCKCGIQEFATGIKESDKFEEIKICAKCRGKVKILEEKTRKINNNTGEISERKKVY